LKKYGAFIIAVCLLLVNFLIIKSLLRSESDLTIIQAEVSEQHLIQREGKNSFKGWVLSVKNTPLRFLIDDDKEKGFDYLSNYNIVGKHVAISYDAKGYYDDNLTSHVYILKVEGKTIMTIEDAEASLKMLALDMLIVDVIVFGIYFKLTGYFKKNTPL
jgi:hypothetical protein